MTHRERFGKIRFDPLARIVVERVTCPGLLNGSEGVRIGFWRRRRDSNPRYGFRPYNGLANRRLQPLGHVSGVATQALSKSSLLPKPQIGTGLAPDWGTGGTRRDPHRSLPVLSAASIALAATASVCSNIWA